MDNDTLCYVMTFLPSILQVKYRGINKYVNEYVLKYAYFDKCIISYPKRPYKIINVKYNFKSIIDHIFNKHGESVGSYSFLNGFADITDLKAKFGIGIKYCDSLQTIANWYNMQEQCDYFIT